MNIKRQVLSSLPWLTLFLSAIFISLLVRTPTVNTSEASFDELLNQIRGGKVTRVEIHGKAITAYLKPLRKGDIPPVLSVGRLPGIPELDFVRLLDSAHVKFSGVPDTGGGWIGTLAILGLPLVLFGLLFLANLRRLANSGTLTFGKNRAKIYDQSAALNVRFNDVAGVDEAKGELIAIVDFLKAPEKYQRLGGRIPRGVLLVGPPGTGKTLLARAVAGEAAVAFFSISGSEFVEMFVGVGAARVRDLFEQAKRKAPCIVFIDELDAVGKSRSGTRAIQGNDEREQTLNQLLVEMDGFDTSKGVIIMAATNAPEVLDPALIRPGRFDRQVVIDRPDVAGRQAILEVHTRKVKMGPSADLATLAARTPGMVGSDLANVVNEAALLAAQRGADEVQMRDLDEAIDRVMLGLEKRSRVMTADEKTRVAFHESGHTLVALSVRNADPVQRVSIIPRSVGALGYTLQLPTHERFLLTQPELEDRIAVLLGGRAAEEIAFEGVISTGASDDLEKASELVRQMITKFGMSEHFGHIVYGHYASSMFLTPRSAEERTYSERTAQYIDEEVRQTLDRIYKRVHSILEDKVPELHTIAAALRQRETLTRSQIDQLLTEASPIEARTHIEESPANA